MHWQNLETPMQLIKKIRLPSSRVSISLILDWNKILDLKNNRELDQLTKVFCQRIDRANNDSQNIIVKPRLAKCEMMKEEFGVIVRKRSKVVIKPKNI
jgi:hypothetical protein